MTDNRIVAVYNVKNVRVKNHNHNTIGDKKKFIYVEYADGNVRHIDLAGRLDITDINYLEVDERDVKPKDKVLVFEEYSVERGRL